MRALLFLVSALLLIATPISAQGLVEVEVSATAATVSVEFPGGIAADLEIAFEQVVGLTAQSLGVSAELVNPTDLGLLARLPSSVAVPAAFPLLVRVEPPATGPLSFRGVASVVLHTHNLTYTAASPLRLYSGPVGGAFEDITVSIGMGSVRAGGSKPGFSEFLITADTRPADDVIAAKFADLQGTLDEHALAIPNLLRDDLQSHLDNAWSLYGYGELLAAIQELSDFASLVVAHSGAEIPDVWRSSRDLDNVAGELRSRAGTLRFSLSYKASLGQ